jgi:hypothetical protein
MGLQVGLYDSPELDLAEFVIQKDKNYVVRSS